MLPPPGYKKAKPGQVCKLKKSLYGLKQAVGQWNVELCKHLLVMGYVQSKQDYSLFVKKTENGEFTAIVAYVDDLLITGSCSSEVEKLKKNLLILLLLLKTQEI